MTNHPENPCPEDVELLRQIAELREPAAFDSLTERYREPLRRFLLSRTDGGDADDLLQETLLRVWTRADSYEGHGPVKAWLFRIAAHLALNQRRTLARRREDSLMVEESGDGSLSAQLADTASLGPDALTLREDRADRLRGLVAELPEETRELLRLTHEEEQPLRDVADSLGIPEGTVKSRLFHARKRLQRAWQSRYDDLP